MVQPGQSCWPSASRKGLWNPVVPDKDPCRADGTGILRTARDRGPISAGTCISVKQELSLGPRQVVPAPPQLWLSH